MLRKLGPIAALHLVLAACAADAPSGAGAWAGTIDTLPNGAVLVKNPAAGVWDGEAGWRLEPELRIGTLDGTGPEMFGEVVDVELDPLGRIYVLERQAREVRVFDAEGRHVRTFGRKGGGPGELEDPIAMRWGADGLLWIVDPRNARYSAFDTAGVYVTSRRRESGMVLIPWPGVIDGEGRLFDMGMRPGGFARGFPGMLLVRLDTAFQPADTFELPSYKSDSFEHASKDGRSFMAANVPFSPGLAWRLDPRGYLWFGITDAYRIVQQTLAGDTLRIIEREWEPVAVTAQDREEARERLNGFVERGGQIDLSRIPATKPAFSSFALDDAGRLWVAPTTASSEEEGSVFDVFDADGRYLGRVRGEGQFAVTSPITRFRGDLVYTTVRDELDVQYVVRARIVPAGGAPSFDEARRLSLR